MNKLKIGLDLDDTVFAFMQSYINKFGLPKSSKEIAKNVYRLRKNKNFWENLPPINIPDFKPELICTKRINSKIYTRKALSKINITNIPIYQLYYYNSKKSKRIKGKCDVFIDDSIDNFIDLNESGIPCLLIDSEWNRHFNTPLRIFSLQYDEIEIKYNQHFKYAK
jgi:hypothetical protein